MELNFKSLPALLDYFKEEKTCVEYLANSIWKDGKPICPHCGSDHIWITASLNKKKVDVPGYRCKACDKKFTVTVGTIFESSKIHLRIWFAAIYLHMSSKKGISSLQLARQIGVTQKTAWFMLQRIREMLKDKDDNKMDGEIEIDETFVGGKYVNMTKKKRERKPDNKNIVMGIIQRGGKVILHHLKGGRLASEMIPLINKSVLPGSSVYTDELITYGQLKATHQHSVIEHRLDKYIDGRTHTQNIEGFWSILKRGIIGIYHYVSAKHLHLYCNEFAYRYNLRALTTSQRFSSALSCSINNRLKYASLIR